jgi:NADPH-dependent 2,4-dienoyl-CoA reductase/sulfur reductase-like enzyme
VLDGSWEPDRTQLRAEDQLDALGAEWRLGTPVEGLDLERRRIRMSGGDELPFDRLVVATGVVPCRLPFGHELAGVHALRTLEDAAALRADLLRGGPLVVVGAGPLGCEVAATARKMGLEVALLDLLELPMLPHVGREVAQRIAALHERRGIRLHLGVKVVALHGEAGRVAAVELADGRRLDASTALIAIGCVPATAWLRGSGVPLGNGVRCDETCRAAEHVYAAGDVAEWFNPRFSRRMRVEHRMNANEQGTVVAANLLGAAVVFEPVPHFWSDQYDVKLQAHGFLAPDATVTVEPHGADEAKFAAVYHRNGVVEGVLGWNIPRELRSYRTAIGSAMQPVPA